MPAVEGKEDYGLGQLFPYLRLPESWVRQRIGFRGMRIGDALPNMSSCQPAMRFHERAPDNDRAPHSLTGNVVPGGDGDDRANASHGRKGATYFVPIFSEWAPVELDPAFMGMTTADFAY
jgi:hypothetical protein